MKTSNGINGRVRQWRPYPAYKSNLSAWCASIPEHWSARRLKFAATAIENKLASKPTDSTYIGLENIESHAGRLLLDAPMEQVDSTVSIFVKNDILFGKLRPYLAKVALAPFTGVCTTEILVLRPGSCVLPRFLFFQVMSDGFIKTVDSATYGVKMPRANSTQVGNLSVSIPPPDEQRRIVAFLDRETAKIDALIAKKERLIELLQEKRTALLNQAVTRGLDPTVPMKESGLEWVQTIPAQWNVLRNGFLFSDRDQRGYPELPILEVSIHTGVNAREFSAEHVEQQAEDPATYKRSLKGDLAFNKMRMWQGAVGVTPVDGLVSPDYQVCRPRPGVCSRYFEQLFRTSIYMTEINRHSHGIVKDRNRLYWDQFKEMPSLVPPPEEQGRIVEHIDTVTKRTGALIAKVREAIEKLHEYRTALISAAVTGKIDVREEAET